jgi:acyl-coenzyme A synthetase/AMP-(fatty) acid ligase
MTSTAHMATVNDRYSDEDIAGYYASGFWQTTSLIDVVDAQAKVRADKRFVFDSSTSLTYGQFREQVLRTAAGLRRQGVAFGDRVAVQLPNWTEFVVLAGAISRVGAVLVPIMPIYRDDEVGFVLRHAGVKLAVTCEEFRKFSYAAMYEQLRSECPDLQTLVIARSAGPKTGRVEFSELVAEGDLGALDVEVGSGGGPDDPYMIVYTSGTTSRPKGCLHTFNTLRASASAIALSLAYTDQDVQFGPSPITHSTGIVTSVLLPLVSGASSHLMEVWEPKEGLRRVKEHGCTVTVTATAFLEMMMAAYDPAEHDPSSLRIWVCAGSPIPGSVVQRAATMLSGGQVLSLYGRSENMLTTMCRVTDPPERSATSDGSALQGASVKVVDAAGLEVDRGTEGDIAYRGPSHMLEYYRDPEQTALLFTADGYSRSGDLGVMDGDGFVRVTGRLKDIIIRGGLNISARELEEVLIGHPAVASVAVVGMPDPRLGERVCVYIVPAPAQPEPTLPDLIALMREKRVSVTKLPERLEIVPELPMTSTGKIQKHLLRADVARKVTENGSPA